MPDNDSPLKTDEHLVALRGMWDEMKLLNRKIDAVRTDLSSRIDQTNERIDTLRTGLSSRIEQTNERIDTLRSEVVRTVADSQIRVSTELLAVGRAVDAVTAVLRQRDTDHDDVADLKERVARLEQRLAP